MIAQNKGLWEKLASPVAIFNTSFSFVYKNPAFDSLLRSFHASAETSFFAALSPLIGAESSRTIYTALHSAESAYEWKGKVQLKSKKASSVLANITIIPFSISQTERDVPQAWFVYFTDLTNEYQTLISNLFSSLLKASELKDNDTGHHIERVNLYSKRLAEAMYAKGSWPEIDIDFISSISVLAAMHDVGKIGTPDDILNKKGPLNEFEWSIMREHTINGAFILSSHPEPMAQQIAQAHHEKWNGSGYPYKLAGNMIPLPARIVAVADVYDALRMKRSYKMPYSHEDSVKFILSESATHFDPAIIQTFKLIHIDFDNIYTQNSDEEASHSAMKRS